MVRNTKSTATHAGAHTIDSDAGETGFNLLYGNTAAVRDLFNGSLAAAQNVAQWMEQSQQLNAQAVNTWSENLGAAMHEAEQAGDIQKLMAVGTNLINRQMGNSMQQFGVGLKQTLETEAQFVERMRNTAIAMSQRMMQGGLAAQPAAAFNGNSDTSPLAQLSHAQAEWMALTQRWLDTVKTAGRQN